MSSNAFRAESLPEPDIPVRITSSPLMPSPCLARSGGCFTVFAVLFRGMLGSWYSAVWDGSCALCAGSRSVQTIRRVRWPGMPHSCFDLLLLTDSLLLDLRQSIAQRCHHLCRFTHGNHALVSLDDGHIGNLAVLIHTQDHLGAGCSVDHFLNSVQPHSGLVPVLLRDDRLLPHVLDDHPSPH